MHGPKRKAIGLSHKLDQKDAPRVVVKGEGVVAEDIIREAIKQNIPITENKSLVESLIKLDYMAEIPEELFELVAETLVFVYETLEEKG